MCVGRKLFSKNIKMIYYSPNMAICKRSPLFSTANVRTVEESSGEDFDDGTNSTNGSLIFVTGLRNLSRSAGKNLKLTCTVQNFDLNNTNVNFFWKRNEVPVVKSDDNRFKIVPNKVRHVDKSLRTQLNTNWRCFFLFRRVPTINSHQHCGCRIWIFSTKDFISV